MGPDEPQKKSGGLGVRPSASRREPYGENPENEDAFHDAFAAMDAANAWDFETKVSQVLSILKIGHLTQPIHKLSGGQRKGLH